MVRLRRLFRPLKAGVQTTNLAGVQTTNLMIPIAIIQLVTIQAQTPPLTLERAIEIALSGSRSVKIARRTAQADAKRADQTAAGGKPQLSVNASALRFDQATKVSLNPQTPPFTVLKEHTETLTLGLSQRIDLYGEIHAATSQARLQSLADDFAVAEIERQRRLTVTILYLTLLKTRGQVKVAEAALSASEAQEKQARTLFEGGIGQKLDVLRASTALSQAVQNLEAARNAEASARAALNDELDQPLEAPLEISELAELEKVSKDTLIPKDIEAQTKTATQKRGDILQAETLIRAAQLGVNVAQAGDKPSLSWQVSGSYYPTTSFQSPRQRTGVVGVSLGVPLSDGGLTRARTEEARLRVENAKLQRDQLQSNVALEVRQAYLNLKTAVRQIENTKNALEQARSARDLAQIRYGGQVGLFIELSDAQSALVRAETNANDAQYDFQIALSRYQSATYVAK